jgi:hypothetical protein
VADVRTEVTRSVCFVFLLFAVAEVVAPYFHVTMSDPLMLTAFITGALTKVLTRADAAVAPPRIPLLVVRSSDAEEFLNGVRGEWFDASTFCVAENAQEAIEFVKKAAPPLGIREKLKLMLTKKSS